MKTALSQQEAIAIAKIYGAKFVAMDDDKAIRLFSLQPKPFFGIFDADPDDHYPYGIGEADNSWPHGKDSLIEVDYDEETEY